MSISLIAKFSFVDVLKSITSIFQGGEGTVMNLCSPCMKLIKSPLLLTYIRVCIEVLVNINAL